MADSFFLTRWLYLGMSWVYEQLNLLFGPSTGILGGWIIVVTILIFTIGIKLLTLFTDIKQRKSSMKMQAIQPELDRIRKKYENDPQKLNVEQQKIMKANGVSTLGGCLPMLIMFPLLIMFFNAFRAWSGEQLLNLLMEIENGNGPETFEGFRFLWITNVWRPDNLKAGGALMSASEFWSTYTTTYNVKDFVFFNNNEQVLSELLYKLHFFTVEFDAAGNMQYVFAKDGGAAFANAYNNFLLPLTGSVENFATRSNGMAILPILSGATTFLSTWLTQRKQPKSDAAGQAGSMKMMMYMMPLITVFFCWQYDATFAFYWTFSNVVSLVVTLILNKTMFKENKDQVEVIK